MLGLAKTIDKIDINHENVAKPEKFMELNFYIIYGSGLIDLCKNAAYPTHL